MNHELVMLRGIKYCKKSIKSLNEQCMNIALRSFSSEKYHDGTLGQAMDLAQKVAEREIFLNYLKLIKTALIEMPRGLRALIVAIYIKELPKEYFCKKYHISPATMYRKLALARDSFRLKLQSLGCDEKWFRDTYGEVEWVHGLLSRTNNGSRISM